MLKPLALAIALASLAGCASEADPASTSPASTFAPLPESMVDQLRGFTGTAELEAAAEFMLELCLGAATSEGAALVAEILSNRNEDASDLMNVACPDRYEYVVEVAGE